MSFWKFFRNAASDPESQSSTSKATVFWVLAPIAIVAIYALSNFPVIVIAARMGIAHPHWMADVLEWVYLPINFGYRHVGWIRDFYDWYGSFFEL